MDNSTASRANSQRRRRGRGGGHAILLLCCLFLLSVSPLQAMPPLPVPDDLPPARPRIVSGQSRIFLPAVSGPAPQQGANPTPVPADLQPFHPERPTLEIYTVQPGDTLLSVAVEMGVDLEQMACLIAPDFSWRQPLVIGDVLRLPDGPFHCHLVEMGETVSSIARRYGVDADRIWGERWNRLIGEPVVGHVVRVPLAAQQNPMLGARPVSPTWQRNSVAPSPAPLPADWPYGSGHFMWPTYGWLSQGFRVGHSAIDIAAPLGTPVTAADRGVVIRAGWSSVGYGNFVVIDHQIDYITLYAHLSEIWVEEGQIVAQGELIGAVGSTGNSTGPHLHFEIRDFGRRIDPLSLLPR